jgi:hypothetical protein
MSDWFRDELDLLESVPDEPIAREVHRKLDITARRGQALFNLCFSAIFVVVSLSILFITWVSSTEYNLIWVVFAIAGVQHYWKSQHVLSQIKVDEKAVWDVQKLERIAHN